MKSKLNTKQARFALVGGLNFAWGLASYPLLYWVLNPLGVNYLVVLVIAYLINTVISFITQKRFVFKTKESKAHQELLRFVGFQGALLVGNLLVLPILVSFIGHPAIAQTTWALFFAVLSYFFHDKVTFRSQSKK